MQYLGSFVWIVELILNQIFRNRTNSAVSILLHGLPRDCMTWTAESPQENSGGIKSLDLGANYIVWMNHTLYTKRCKSFMEIYFREYALNNGSNWCSWILNHALKNCTDVLCWTTRWRTNRVSKFTNWSNLPERLN